MAKMWLTRPEAGFTARGYSSLDSPSQSSSGMTVMCAMSQRDTPANSSSDGLGPARWVSVAARAHCLWRPGMTGVTEAIVEIEPQTGSGGHSPPPRFAEPL